MLNRQRGSVIILYAIYFGNGPRDTTRECFSSGRTTLVHVRSIRVRVMRAQAPTTAFFYPDDPYYTRPFCRAELPTRRAVYIIIRVRTFDGAYFYIFQAIRRVGSRNTRLTVCYALEMRTGRVLSTTPDDVTFIPKRRVAILRYPLL